MSYRLEMAEKACLFLREVEHQDITVEEIMTWPYWQQVWCFWLYDNYYNGYQPQMTVEECKTIYSD